MDLAPDLWLPQNMNDEQSFFGGGGLLDFLMRSCFTPHSNTPVCVTVLLKDVQRTHSVEVQSRGAVRWDSA